MPAPTKEYLDLKGEIASLRIGKTLGRFLNLKLRQSAYAIKRELKIELCIRELPMKPGQFEVTRIR
jgi:hypothetical protein